MRWLMAILLAVLAAGAAKAQTASSIAAAAAAEIETVGFYNAVRFGVGGMMTFEPRPIVLFRNGEALRRIDGLGEAAGLAAHKAAHPKDWTRWRRSGAQIEVQGEEGWEKLPYTKVMGPLPSGHRLTATYQRLGGGGNTAMGGTTMIAAWASFTFDAGGGFTTEGGVGATSKAEQRGGAQVTINAPRGAERGRYEIEGYALTLAYEGGRTERRFIVFDPADPESALWIDGHGYARRR